MKLIDLSVLKYQFLTKPVLIGGKAMEYYGLRKAGNDIDFVVTKEDFDNLVKLYPKNKKDIFGDLGIGISNFEIWKSIRWFNYSFLSEKSIEEKNYKIISLEKLLLIKVFVAYDEKLDKAIREKSERDLKFLVKKIQGI